MLRANDGVRTSGVGRAEVRGRAWRDRARPSRTRAHARLRVAPRAARDWDGARSLRCSGRHH